MSPGIISKPKEDITDSGSEINTGTDQKGVLSTAKDVALDGLSKAADNFYDTMNSGNKWSLSDSVRNERGAESGRFNLNARKKITDGWTYK
ncbi:hypothetical protein Ddc_18082 [Ditylenchus destructor]|nr:hypothetical protein Ddc_18082 [Ditylenchus destructor]